MKNADFPAMPNSMDVQTLSAMAPGDESLCTVQGLGRYIQGMTKREYMATLVMQGEIAAQNSESGFWRDDGDHPRILARRCVVFADALLAELENV